VTLRFDLPIHFGFQSSAFGSHACRLRGLRPLHSEETNRTIRKPSDQRSRPLRYAYSLLRREACLCRASTLRSGSASLSLDLAAKPKRCLPTTSQEFIFTLV
jgi:hypothetical protein